MQSPTNLLLRAAKELEQCGLIAVSRRTYVQCAEPTDRDYPRTKNRACAGRVHLRNDADEAGCDYRCPECQRAIFPSYFKKTRYAELGIEICTNGIVRFIRDKFQMPTLLIKDQAHAVFRIEGWTRNIHICMVDLCMNEHFLTRDWARVQPTMYIAVDESTMQDRFLPESWVSRCCLADVFCGAIDLVAASKRLAEGGPPSEVLNASVPIYTTGPRPIIGGRNSTSPGRQFLVEVTEKSIFINGHPVVATQAKSRHRIFNVLWQQFLDDLREGRVAEQSHVLTIKEVAKRLAKDGSPIDHDAIRRALNRFQVDIERAVKMKLGDPIDREDIIEIVRWTGQNESKFGYRINPWTVVARPPQTAAPEASSKLPAARASRG